MPKHKQKKATVAVVVDEAEHFLKQHVGEWEAVQSDDGSNKRIRCTVTGHEMARSLELMRAHWQGKAFKRALRRKGMAELDLAQFAPHITTHRHNEGMLYCRLTKKSLNKDRGEVLGHMEGRKFRNALAKWKEKQERKRKRMEEAMGSGAMQIPGVSEDEHSSSVEDDEPLVTGDGAKGRMTGADEFSSGIVAPVDASGAGTAAKDNWDWDEAQQIWQPKGSVSQITNKKGPSDVAAAFDFSGAGTLSFPVAAGDDTGFEVVPQEPGSGSDRDDAGAQGDTAAVDAAMLAQDEVRRKRKARELAGSGNVQQKGTKKKKRKQKRKNKRAGQSSQ